MLAENPGQLRGPDTGRRPSILWSRCSRKTDYRYPDGSPGENTRSPA